MKRGLIVVTALGLLAASFGIASAQGQRRGGMFGRAGGLQMLRMEPVQQELKMTPEQVGKIQTKQQEVMQAMRDAFQSAGGFQQMSPEERQKLMAKMQDLQEKAVADILSTDQLKRYHQLDLQLAGPTAIAQRPALQEALKLTAEQKTKIADIERQSNEDRRAAMQGVDFQNMSAEDRQKLMDKNQSITKAAGEKIVAVLNDDQKKQWTAMLGEPFKFPQPNRPGVA